MQSLFDLKGAFQTHAYIGSERLLGQTLQAKRDYITLVLSYESRSLFCPIHPRVEVNLIFLLK